MTFAMIEYRDGCNTFALLCPGCGADGELGVRPTDRKLIECPNRCGALFMQRGPHSFFARPVLEYVAGAKIQEPYQLKARNRT